MSDPTLRLIYEQLYRPTEPNDPLPDPDTSSTTRRLWATAERIRDALTAAGWVPRCDCDGVAHDLPILRSHIRGEPDCKAAIDAGCLPKGSDEGSTDA